MTLFRRLVVALEDLRALKREEVALLRRQAALIERQASQIAETRDIQAKLNLEYEQRYEETQRTYTEYLTRQRAIEAAEAKLFE